MPTRNLIRDIVEASKASVADPNNRAEVNEAGTTSALVVCYALGEILDELIERVRKLEQRVAQPADLSPQLREIRDQIARVQKGLGKDAKPKKSKK
jgi:hypothetical protein